MDNMTVPYSAEAEASVLGSVMFNPQQITVVAEKLKSSDAMVIRRLLASLIFM